MSSKKDPSRTPRLSLNFNESGSDGPWSPGVEDFDKLIAEQEGQWSPTPDDFDKLIAEQDCFEISLREQKELNEKLTKENRRLREEAKKSRQAHMKAAQELQAMNMKCSSLEKEAKSLEELCNSKTSEIETLQKEIAGLKLELSTKESDGPHSLKQDVNNNESPIKIQSTYDGKKADVVKRTRRSLVSQLVQGFEAVVAAKKLESTLDRKNRRKTTIN